MEDTQGLSSVNEVSPNAETVESTETVAPVVSEESKEVVTAEQVTEPESVAVKTIESGEFAGAFAYSEPEPTADSQIANPESEQKPEPIKIHPFDLAVILEKAVDANPDLQIIQNSPEEVIVNGVLYHQTVEVEASDEGKAKFEAQVAKYLADQKRKSLAGIREELDALKAEVEDLKARIDDHNSRSGHKI